MGRDNLTKGKYIKLNIKMACTKKRKHVKTGIHALLEEAIAERKRIIHQLENYTQTARIVRLIFTGT